MFNSHWLLVQGASDGQIGWMNESLIKYQKRGARFVPPHHKGASFTDIMKWMVRGDRAKWPKRVANHKYVPVPRRVGGKKLAVTWIGHATALIQTADLNILTDPFFSKRASPLSFLGPQRVRDPGLALKKLPPIDLILLSHSHYDHLDRPTLKWLSRNHQARLITPLNNARHAPWFDTSELDWHQSVELKSAKITALPALHWAKRTMNDTNKSLWAAFMIETEGGNIYFGADTGFGAGDTFREANRLFGAPRLSLLPIGAYEPRWFMAPQHMNPEEAVQAHQLLGAKQSLAIHHGTIQLTDEAIDAPPRALEAALLAAGLSGQDFLVPDIGETVWID